jgi:BMFP domain-containing protein YqiC
LENPIFLCGHYSLRQGNAKLPSHLHQTEIKMIETLLQAILEQVDQPKKDLEHNVRALLNEAVSKMDLVSKEEMERQRTALNNANLRLNELLQQVEMLEQKIQNKK